MNNVKNITLSIFVPCLNEEKNITDALNMIKEAIQNINYEILVVDDASKDKTIEMVEKFKNNNPNLDIKILRNERNKGLGFGYFAAAHKASGKYYMPVFGDSQQTSKSIKKLMSNIGKADMILSYYDFSYKSIFSDTAEKRSLIRKVISKLFTNTINLITFNKIKYYNGPAIHLLENVKLCNTDSNGFGYHAELITFLLNSNKTYMEVELESTCRKSGTSKAVSLKNSLSVCRSVIVIFLNQIIHIIKKLLKTKKSI